MLFELDELIRSCKENVVIRWHLRYHNTISEGKPFMAHVWNFVSYFYGYIFLVNEMFPKNGESSYVVSHSEN